MVVMSKIATGNGHGENSPYFDGWKAYETNPFHPKDRPDGVIQMGLAENQVITNIQEFCSNITLCVLLETDSFLLFTSLALL